MRRGLALALVVSVLHPGCPSVPTKTYDARRRAQHQPGSLVQDYLEESLSEHPLMSPPVNPTHLDATWLPSHIMDEQAKSRTQLALKKVTKFVDSPQGEEFPQTSTMFQWYELEEFEAYRQLGYLMGWAYLSSLSFNEAELTPAAACHAL
jgi:hypothetical protein